MKLALLAFGCVLAPRNFRQVPIAKIGDAETRMVLAEWGVEMRNPLAHILLNGIKQGDVIGSP